MDYRNVWGVAAIVLSGAVFVHSLKTANAFPQGPNVSTGSNPIDSFYTLCDSGFSTIFTNTSSKAFIITDVVKENYSNHTFLRVNGTDIFQSEYGSQGSSRSIRFSSGLKVNPSDVVECSSSGDYLTISGYYVHP